MGYFLDFLLGRQPLAAETLPGPEFSVDRNSIDPALFGLTSWSDATTVATPVKRDLALQVPAVVRARNIIAGTLGGIPMVVVHGSTFEVEDSALLEQPERNVARSITYVRLFEDLLLDGIAWWRVAETNFRGFPTKIEREDPNDISVRGGEVYVRGARSTSKFIRFDGPNPGICTRSGGRAIRTLLRLEASAQSTAEDPMPQGYFAPVEDSDPLTDDEIRELLASWKAARQAGSTGYVPAALKYEAVQFSPKDLQLIEARQHAVLEIARLTGIDAEDLSVSTTSRTYANLQDRRLQRIADVLGPYSLAVTDRLRMSDVTPLGYEVRADFSQFLRADDATRLANYRVALDLGLLDLDGIAAREGVPTLQAPAPARPAALAAVPDPTEKSA